MNTETVTNAQVTTTASESKTAEPVAAPTTEVKEITPPVVEASAVAPVVEKKEEAKPTETDKASDAVLKEIELKLPEKTLLDPSIIEKAKTLAKEKGWSNERTQEYVQDQHSAVEEYSVKAQESLKSTNETVWKQELFKDKEIGGAKFEESAHLAARAAKAFGGEEFADKLKTMNLNYYPDLFKMLTRVGKAMADDTVILPNTHYSGANVPAEQNWYPNMFKKEGDN